MTGLLQIADDYIINTNDIVDIEKQNNYINIRLRNIQPTVTIKYNTDTWNILKQVCKFNLNSIKSKYLKIGFIDNDPSPKEISEKYL